MVTFLYGRMSLEWCFAGQYQGVIRSEIEVGINDLSFAFAVNSTGMASSLLYGLAYFPFHRSAIGYDIDFFHKPVLTHYIISLIRMTHHTASDDVTCFQITLRFLVVKYICIVT